MAKNGWKWLELLEIDWIQLEMAGYCMTGQKLIEIDRNGWKWLEMTGIA